MCGGSHAFARPETRGTISIAISHRPLGVEDLLSPVVRAFDCGSEVWEMEINGWLLAGPDVLGGAYDELSLSGNPAWQHYDELESLVEISSMGAAIASYPKNSSPRLPAVCLTWLAVDKNHRQKGYGQVILDFLVAEAPRRYPEAQLIVALVHIQNPALHWYCNARNQFERVGAPSTKSNGSYQRIVRKA